MVLLNKTSTKSSFAQLSRSENGRLRAHVSGVERTVHMTKNQIEFYAARNNAYRDRVSEAQRAQEIAESVRTHRANEAENKRQNQAREKENERTNRANEQIQRDKNVITLGYNNGYLGELNRHNLATEFNEQQKIDTANRQADASISLSAMQEKHLQQQNSTLETQRRLNAASTNLISAQTDQASSNAALNKQKTETEGFKTVSEAFKSAQENTNTAVNDATFLAQVVKPYVDLVKSVKGSGLAGFIFGK